MATRYARSTDGNNTDDGSTWALAKLDAAGLAAIDVAGDDLYLSQSHAESTAAAITLAFAGTAANWTKLVCANDAAEPPTAVATTATIATTGASNIAITGHLYCYGVTYNCGSGGSAASISLANASEAQRYENSTFNLQTASTGAVIAVGSVGVDYTTHVEWKNCNVSFAHAGQRIRIGASFFWDGGVINAGSATPTSIFQLGVRNSGSIVISGVDCSALASTVNIFANTTGKAVRPIIRNGKLPAGWSGSLWSAPPAVIGMRAEMYNCDAGNTNYRLWIDDYAGSIKDETTLVRTGGASDGVTPISWKMTSSANVSYHGAQLVSGEFTKRVTTVGSPVTLTIEILHDNITPLTDAEIGVKAQYLGTTGFPLSLFVHDLRATILTAPTNQDASTATWVTTGMSNPNKQKLIVTFTPVIAGVVLLSIVLARASYTVYVDPMAS